MIVGALIIAVTYRPSLSGLLSPLPKGSAAQTKRGRE
jgi:hypothetical protein